MNKFGLFIGTLGVALILVSCGERPPAGEPGNQTVGEKAGPAGVAETNLSSEPAPPVYPRIFLVKGVIRELMPERDRVRIAHEQIPDYMEAMTMEFKVKGSNALNRVAVGDTVRFRMTVTEKDGWIDNLVKDESVEKQEPPDPATFRRALDVEPVNVGEMMPEYHLTNEMGKAVSLSDYRGQSVAMTFLFTRCPFPTFCPLMAGNFAAAQEKLKKVEGIEGKWKLLTVTFDPDFDTPEVLSAYAKGFGYEPDKWSFLTGKLIDITALAEQFGLLFWRPDPAKPAGIDHNLRTLVIDSKGRVQHVFAQNEWTVDELVAEVVKGVNPPAAPAGGE